jgi:hypothetical protein
MNIRKKIVILFFSFSLFFLSVVNSANAQWDKGLLEAGKFKLPAATASDIVANLVSWLLGIFAFFGIIGFIVSGIMYLVSAGNEEMIGKAKKYMLYSLVGVIVGLIGYVIIQAVGLMLSAQSF